MWKIGDNTQGQFEQEDWRLSLRTSIEGIEVNCSHAGQPWVSPAIRLSNAQWPSLTEAFVRGDSLHWMLPAADRMGAGTSYEAAGPSRRVQGTDLGTSPGLRGQAVGVASPAMLDPNAVQPSDTGLEIVWSIVQADADLFIMESVLGLQTLSLDAYPALEVTLDDVGPSPAIHATEVIDQTTVCLWRMPQGERSLHLALLIDERDRWSIDGDVSGVPLRFFGEFLEKGVIRKVQPWWVWSQQQLSPERLATLVSQLRQRPLPLAG